MSPFSSRGLSRAGKKCEPFLSGDSFSFSLSLLGKKGGMRYERNFFVQFFSFLFFSFILYSGKIPSILQDIGTEIEGGERGVQGRTPSESFGQFWRLEREREKENVCVCVCLCEFSFRKFLSNPCQLFEMCCHWWQGSKLRPSRIIARSELSLLHSLHIKEIGRQRQIQGE